MVAATHRLEAVDRQAATPMAVQAVIPQLANTTVDQRVTKEWLTIAATIGFRRVIVTAVMDERPRATMTIVTMVIDHRHGHFVNGVWVWYGAPFASNDSSWLRHRAMPRAALIGWSRYTECAY